MQEWYMTVGTTTTRALPGGGAVGVMVNWANAENVLLTPFELMATTDTVTVYSALGTKFCRVTLVLEVFTVV